MTSEEEAPATVEQWADLDFEPIDSKTLEDIKPVSNDRWAETGKEMLPCDEAEAMLIAQMIETHELAMTFARRLKHVENIPQQDSAVNGLTKLTRTYAAQMASLKHYRTGGEQRVIVQWVDVREGGQAVVGVVNSGKGGEAPNKSEVSLMRLPMHEAPRCCAMSKRSRKQCQAPAVRGRRTCRMHGGTNPGAPTGKAHGNYRSGIWTKEWLKLRPEASVLRRQARLMIP